MRGLAEYLSWSYDKVKKLSAPNLIPGKVKHDGKVTFHLPTVDAWLQTEHAQQVLRWLPHEEREFKQSDDAAATYGVAAGRTPLQAFAATHVEG
jgi:hypothetical protein